MARERPSRTYWCLFLYRWRRGICNYQDRVTRGIFYSCIWGISLKLTSEWCWVGCHLNKISTMRRFLWFQKWHFHTWRAQLPLDDIGKAVVDKIIYTSCLCLPSCAGNLDCTRWLRDCIYCGACSHCLFNALYFECHMKLSNQEEIISFKLCIFNQT